MPREYDFEMIKRAYAEMARRARRRDQTERSPGEAIPSRRPPSTFEAQEEATGDEAER